MLSVLCEGFRKQLKVKGEKVKMGTERRVANDDEIVDQLAGSMGARGQI